MNRDRLISAILGLFFLFSAHVYAMPGEEAVLKIIPELPRPILRGRGVVDQRASNGRVTGKRLRYAEEARSDDGQQSVVPQNSAGKSLPYRLKRKQLVVEGEAAPQEENTPPKRRRTVFGEQVGDGCDHVMPDVFQVITCAEAVQTHLLEARRLVQASSEHVKKSLLEETCRIVPDRRVIAMCILLSHVEVLLQIFVAWKPKKSFSMRVVKDLAKNIGLHQEMFRGVAAVLAVRVKNGDGSDEVSLAEKELAARQRVVKLCRQCQYAEAAMALLDLRQRLQGVSMLEHESAEDLCRCFAVEVEQGSGAALKELYVAQSLQWALGDFLRLVESVRVLDLTPPAVPESGSPASWLDWACWLHDAIADLEYEISSDEDSEADSDEGSDEDEL